jgi:hypothetical protein
VRVWRTPVAQDKTTDGFCERGNEPSVSIKDGKFLDQLSDSYSLK